MPQPNVDPRLVPIATRLRALRVEVDRLDDAVDMLDRDDRRPYLMHSAVIRGRLDALDETVEHEAVRP